MKIVVPLVFLAITAQVFPQAKAEVFFEFDRYDLASSQTNTLDGWLESNPDAEVMAVYGYCDHLGSVQYNDTLSLRRARTVVDYLREHDAAFSPDYEVIGYGEQFPRSGIRSKNRKVAVLFREVPPAQTRLDAPKAEVQQDVEKAAVGDKIRLRNLNFYNLSDQIVPRSRPVLEDLLKTMRDNPNLRIEIQGHICCQTVRERDYAYVSTLRAKAVYNYLVKNGIDAQRLSYKGFGVSQPLHPIPEKNEQEQDDNRRVEIQVLSN